MKSTSYFRTRRSTQSFDASRRIPLDVLHAALDDARYSPSPFNIQPWRFLVLTREDSLARLRDVANRQNKVVDAGTAVVFLADLEAEEYAEAIVDAAVADGTLEPEASARWKGAYPRLRGLGKGHLVRRDMREAVMVAAMAFMTSVHMRGYDTCPIGGFDPEALRAAFDIAPRFDPVVLCPTGCRKTAAPGVPKRRFELGSLVALDAAPEFRPAFAVTDDRLRVSHTAKLA
jgi:nitroreductase